MAWTRTSTTTPDEMGSCLLRLPDVLLRTGLSWAAVSRMETGGEFPRAVQISRRAIGWHEADIGMNKERTERIAVFVLAIRSS